MRGSGSQSNKNTGGLRIKLVVFSVALLLAAAVIAFGLLTDRTSSASAQPSADGKSESALVLQTTPVTPVPTVAPTERPAEPEETPAPTPEPERVTDVAQIRIDIVGKVKWSYTTVTCTVTDVYGNTVLQDEAAQVRRHGNSTQQVDKRSYKLKLSESADLLGLGKGKNWVLLSNVFDKTLLRNRLMYDLAGEIGLAYSSKSTAVDVYLGNDYRGSYLLTEPAEIGSDRVDIHMADNEFLLELEQPFRLPEGVLIRTPLLDIQFGIDGCDYLPADQRDYLNNLFLKAETALTSHDRAAAEQYFDIASFVDMYIVNEFSKNADTNIASTRFYVKDGRIYAGPVWDFDMSCGNDCTVADFRHKYNNTQPSKTDGWYAAVLWYKEFAKCDWFDQLFAERYLELQPILLNLCEDNELGQNRIDVLTSAMPDSINRNFSLWPVGTRAYHFERFPESTYEGNVEFLRTWLKERNDWILFEISAGGKIIDLYPD